MFTVILRSQAPKLSKFPEGSYHWGTRCNPRRSKRRGWGFWGRQLAGWGMSSQMWNLAPCSCDERKHWRMLLYFPVPMKDATLLGIWWRWNFKTKKTGSHSLKDGNMLSGGKGTVLPSQKSLGTTWNHLHPRSPGTILSSPAPATHGRSSRKRCSCTCCCTWHGGLIHIWKCRNPSFKLVGTSSDSSHSWCSYSSWWYDMFLP